MANGYMGKFLWVDLAANTLKEEPLDEKLCRNYIGGYGIGAKILFDRQKAGVDPLGPDNILGFVTGPFTGTQALGGSRYAVVAKSPLTGTWGDANSGGSFGPGLKFAGFDAVFFTGIASKPVFLLIDNGKAELRDAAEVWGKDSYETEDYFKNKFGKDVEVACIGPAGEKLSLISGVINNKGRAAARSGLGAVMGSKKIKAIVVKGNQQISVFDVAKTLELRKNYTGKLGGPSGLFKQFGTPGLTIGCIKGGDTPVKNWGGAGEKDFPSMDNIDGNQAVSRQQRKYGCYRCVIACGGHMKEGTAEYKYLAGVHKPEYETIGLFGSSCLNSNFDSIIKANDICNRAGLDTISTGATIAFVIECFENGILTKKDTDGLEMTWGNHQAIIAMTQKLADKDGFGAIIGDGVKRAAEKIGRGSEKYAMHIQGQEYPAHDPKFSYQFACGYRMDATPGRHTRSGGNGPGGLPKPNIDPDSWSGRGEAQKIDICFKHCAESTGCCAFVSDSYPAAAVLAEFLTAVTGWNITIQDVLSVGERIANVRQAFNIREGINPLKFQNPNRMIGQPPIQYGPHAGQTIDEATIDREFCEAMQWDVQTTEPSKKRLVELGMEDVAGVF